MAVHIIIMNKTFKCESCGKISIVQRNGPKRGNLCQACLGEGSRSNRSLKKEGSRSESKTQLSSYKNQVPSSLALDQSDNTVKMPLLNETMIQNSRLMESEEQHILSQDLLATITLDQSRNLERDLLRDTLDISWETACFEHKDQKKDILCRTCDEIICSHCYIWGRHIGHQVLNKQ